MVIRFLCPNGHKIHCPDDRAGQPAKCPKCNVRFRIPELSEVADFGGPLGSSGDGGSAVGAASDQIEFLCPNGHRLYGPRSLQGRPGQCPDCGAKFQVPSYQQPPQPTPSKRPVPEVDLNELITTGSSIVNLKDFDVMAESDETADLPEVSEAARVREAGPLDPSESGNPLLDFLVSHWSEKSQGAVIEVHLTDGTQFVPDRFAQAASQGSHAHFAETAPDGTHTVSLVAWESISRIRILGLKQLPEEFA